MLRNSSLIPLLALAGLAGAQTTPSAVMLRYPDVSQHSIVFRYAGDLWLVDKEGGEARRISSGDAPKSFPKFSPDGSRLAYMAGYDGGTDLYVMSVEGGIPERLTHHSGQEVLCDWHPSGEALLFWGSQISGQARAPKIFTVPAAGGQPSALPLPYGTFGAIDPTGTWLAYTPNSREFRTWKRYRGGRAQDVWLFNLKTRQAQKITSHPGTDSLPMWHGQQVVFLSDRGDEGRMNLYAYDLDTGETERLTNFTEDDIKFPSMGPEDVVFENGGKLYRYAFESRDVIPVEVIIPGDRPALRPKIHDVSSLLQGIEMGPGHQRVAVEARGEVFTVPVENGFVRNLTRSSGGRGALAGLEPRRQVDRLLLRPQRRVRADRASFGRQDLRRRGRERRTQAHEHGAGLEERVDLVPRREAPRVPDERRRAPAVRFRRRGTVAGDDQPLGRPAGLRLVAGLALVDVESYP